MPLNITTETPRADRTIGGVSVKVPSPYLPGHVLTEGEAKQLNQVLAENVSNNLRKKIDGGVLEGEGDNATSRDFTVEEAQALVDTYMETYEPGVRTAGSGEPRVTDPVEREARKIAREKALELVKANGLKAKDVDMGDITDKIFEANRDLLMAEGKKIVKAREKAAEASGGIDLSGIAVAAAAPAPAGGEGEAQEPAAA